MAGTLWKLAAALPLPGIHSKTVANSLSALPSELLFEIFFSAVSDPEFSPDSSLYPVTNTCLVLAAVCRSWRDCAMRFPALWSFIKVQTVIGKALIPMLNLWLERSQNSLLNINVYVGSYHSHITSSLVATLILHSKRWESIQLQLSDSLYYSEVFNTLDNPDIELPHLRSARLHKLKQVPKCFKNAPLLAHLDVRLYLGCPARDVFLSMSEGYQGLKTLSVERGRATAKQVAEVLAKYPRLSSFTVEMNPDESDGLLPTTASIVPNLTYLELRLSCRILRVLQCPNLHTLHLTTDNSTHGGQSMDGLKDLPLFVSHSPNLKSLILYPADDLSWMSNPRIFGSSLEHLQLGFSDRPYDSGFNKINDPYILPSLTTISLSFRSAIWEESHLRTVKDVLPYLPTKKGSPPPHFSRPDAFPALEKLNVRISLWGRNVRNDGATIVWIEKWRKLEKSVLQGALALTLALPREGQGGIEVLDFDAWSDMFKVEETPKGLGKAWSGLASRFR